MRERIKPLKRLSSIGFNLAKTAGFPWIGKAPSSPLMVYVELTRRCNLQCRHCDIWKTRETQTDLIQRELSTEHLLSTFHRLARHGLMAVDLFGGEPLLRNDLPELVQGLRALGLHVTVTTNGLLLSDSLSRKLVDAGLNQLLVSLDAPVAGTHDDLRGVDGTFHRVVAGIRTLQKHNNGTVRLGINTLVCRPTLQYLPEMPDFARSLDAVQIRLLPYHQCYPFNQWQQDDELLPRREEWPVLRKNIQQFWSRSVELGLSTNGRSYIDGIVGWFEGTPRPRGCVAGLAVCDINGFGEVFPCYTVGESVGSLHEATFEELWNSAKMDQFRTDHRRCDDCWQSCYIEPGLRLNPIHAVRDYRTVLHDLQEYLLKG